VFPLIFWKPIEEGVRHRDRPVADLAALLQRLEIDRTDRKIHPVSGELQGFGDPAARIGHYHAEGAHLAPVVLGSGRQEALTLLRASNIDVFRQK